MSAAKPPLPLPGRKRQGPVLPTASRVRILPAEAGLEAASLAEAISGKSPIPAGISGAQIPLLFRVLRYFNPLQPQRNKVAECHRDCAPASRVSM